MGGSSYAHWLIILVPIVIVVGVVMALRKKK